MKRLIKTLAATFAALAASAGTALAAGPVQSGTQSSSTTQAAVAASSATQVQPSNQNVSVRVLSPGNDGAVSQSNDASSSADATNTASTAQNTTQALGAACGCAITPIRSGKVDDVLGSALQAAGSSGSTQAPQAAPQSAPAGSGGGVQSSHQDATTGQTALAGSSAEQDHPSNSNISVRVLSPGNDGAVSQSNEASSSADASNSATTTQGSSQTGGGSGGVQSSTQSADTTQGSLAESSATQDHPENSNLSVRVLSPGNGGSVSQSNEAESFANAENTAPVTQTSTQSQAGSSCGCNPTSPAVQEIGQSSSLDQGAGAASSAEQSNPSNLSDPIRISSDGNDGRLNQENEASSEATASNTAPVTQTGSQQQAGSSCGCSSGPAVQALGQSSEIGQTALAESSATQDHPENSNLSVRILSPGDGGAVSQSNEAESSATAENTAPVTQTSTQSQAGSSCGCDRTSPAVQEIGQWSSVDQRAGAASSAEQTNPSNASDPIRISSDGNDGRLTQENEASSDATAANTAPVTQTGSQQQAGTTCGCSSGPAVQALGQSSEVGQLAVALSSARQAGAKNESGPIRIASDGNGGTVSQSNEVESSADASNTAPVGQTGTQQQAGSGVQALGQESEILQGALATSAAFQLPGESRCGCGASSGNSADPVRIYSDGNDGNLTQENEVSSSSDASNLAAPTQQATQTQASSKCGCSGLSVQALGQLSTIDQIAAALSSATQIGASNASGPVRVWSTGGGGSTRQSNEASSESTAPNVARILQAGQQELV